MLIKIIKNSITQNKMRKSLTFLTCFLSTLLICTMLNITLSIAGAITKQLRSYGSNIIILPKGASFNIEVGNESFEPLKNSNYLPQNELHKIKEIFWQNNISAFAPFLEGKVFLNNQKEVLLSGTFFNKHILLEDEEDFHTGIKSLYPFLQIQGKWVEDDDLQNLMVGELLAQNNSLKLGDMIELQGKKFKIVGILKGEDKFLNKIVTSLALAQALFDKEGLYSRVEVSALTIPEDDLARKARTDVSSLNALEHDTWYCSAYVGSIAYQIQEELSGASAKPLNAISDAESFIVKKIQSLIGITSIICIVVGALAIYSLMSSSIHIRKKEIGLLKALGANNFEIYAIFAGENLILALLGACFGFICSIGLCQIIALNIFGYFINISLLSLILSLVFASLITLLGCFLALKNIINLQAKEVLYDR